jgi:competence protein ComEA
LWAAGPIERATIGGLASAVAVVVLIVVAGVMLVHRHHAGGTTSYSSSYADAANSPAPDPVSSSVSDAASIVVDVGGRVRKPGLVTLPAGARVADAIDAAGGPLHRRELDQIDLAQRVTDGQLLLIGIAPSTSGAGEAAGSAPSDTSGPISLSTGSLEQLETLPGVGPVTAQKIIDYRTAHGGFSTVEQLQQVPGIGPAHYAEISPLVTP